MKRAFALLVFVCLLPMLLSGCTGGSPSGAVTAFYKAGNEGYYARAKSYLSIHSQMVLEQMSPLGMPSFEEAMDAATKDGTIVRIEIKGGEKYGSNAVVYLNLYYEDGSQEQDTCQLRKEGGRWKIYISSLLMSAPLKRLIP